MATLFGLAVPIIAVVCRRTGKPGHCQADLPGGTMQLANKTRGMKALLNPELLRVLACPWDHTPLHIFDGGLVCENAHNFTLEAGTPILTDHVRREPVPRNMEPCAHLDANGPIDPFVRDWLVEIPKTTMRVVKQSGYDLVDLICASPAILEV